MAAELIVAPEAEQDIDEAYAWYEGQRVGLGEEFMSCVDACIEAIRRTPEMHQAVHETYRRALIRRFPYAVFSNTRTTQSPFTACSIPRRIRTNGGAASTLRTTLEQWSLP